MAFSPDMHSSVYPQNLIKWTSYVSSNSELPSGKSEQLSSQVYVIKGAISMESIVKRIENFSSATTSAAIRAGMQGMTLINSVRNNFIKELERVSTKTNNSNESQQKTERSCLQDFKSQDSSIQRIIDSARNDSERGDVPGWVLVVLMTTGLVTAIWTIAAPRLSAILKNSLDAMNGIR